MVERNTRPYRENSAPCKCEFSKVIYNKIKSYENLRKYANYENVVKYLYQPTDPSSLGIVRFLFGLLMLFDIQEERGGANIDIKWGEPKDCHFPLFSFLKPLDYPQMSLLYGVMWLGAFGIMVGFKLRTSTLCYGIPYWYLFLLDKTYWNNHSYLFGVICILILGSSANNYWSLDGLCNVKRKNCHVPYWNYFILKYQFFMLYFLAGLKKTDFEWLEGYSMSNLGTHWVFTPFQIFLTPDQIDFFVIHWFGFILDLTIGFWMLMPYTRRIAFIFCALFHLMNSRLFAIGMFPYVCLATMPLFCEEKWPKKVYETLTKTKLNPARASEDCIYSKEECKKYNDNNLNQKVTWKNKLVIGLLLTHCGLQVFLPYSHFITKGFNNWTNGLYGYSWDMMVHSWDTVMVVIKVVDNYTGHSYFIDSKAFAQNDRWTKHADMCVQYAQCLKRNLITDFIDKNKISDKNHVNENKDFLKSDSISIYIDVWCSLNSRFQQRMYNPDYDLLKASWSPFKPVEWLMPVLNDFSNFRSRMIEITKEVHKWSNESDVLFVADFPGMYLENFISHDLCNVTLTVIEGVLIFEEQNFEDAQQSRGVKLEKGESLPIETGIFHKIHTISKTPSSYMYTYLKADHAKEDNPEKDNEIMYAPFPVFEDIQKRIHDFKSLWGHIINSFMYLFFNRSLTRRGNVNY